MSVHSYNSFRKVTALMLLREIMSRKMMAIDTAIRTFFRCILKRVPVDCVCRIVGSCEDKCKVEGPKRQDGSLLACVSRELWWAELWAGMVLNELN